MQVTQENEQMVRVFIRILNDKKVSRDAIKYSIAAIQNEEQMDKLVEFIKNNSQISESEIMNELDKIINNI